MSKFKEIEEAYARAMFARDGGAGIDILSLYRELEDKSITDGDGRSLLHVAARYADYQAIRLLGEAGAKPRADEDDNTPLHAQVNSPLTNMLDTIIAKGDEIFKTTQALLELKVNAKKKNQQGKIAYYEAGAKYMYPVLEAMAQAGVKMDAVDGENKNLMHLVCSHYSYHASKKGFAEAAYRTVKAVLESGVDPEDRDVYGTTPIEYAQRSGAKEIAALLSGDDAASATGGMTMQQAVYAKDVQALEALIQGGASVDELSEQGKTPLMAACEYPSLDIVKLLLKHGADANYRSGQDGRTAMHYLLGDAIHNLNRGVAGGQSAQVIIKILQALVDGGLQPDAPIDQQGNTALHVACGGVYLADMEYTVVEELIDAGADINATNQAGQTPIMVFAATGNEQKSGLAELLIDNDADLAPVDSAGNTALMYAASNTNLMSAKKIAERMLETGTLDTARANNNNATALDIAVERGNDALVKLLLM